MKLTDLEEEQLKKYNKSFFANIYKNKEFRIKYEEALAEGTKELINQMHKPTQERWKR